MIVKINEEQEGDYKESKEIILQQKGYEEIPEKLLNSDINNNTKCIDLSWNELTELPLSFYSHFPNLESLNLQNNKLININKEISKMKELKILKLDHNQLICLPQTIGDLIKLEILSASKNNLFTIPCSIGNLKNSLFSLSISNNSIRLLPPEIGLLSFLKELHIANNTFQYIPCSFCGINRLDNLSLDWFYYTPFKTSHLKDDTAFRAFNILKDLFGKAHSKKRAEITVADFFQYFFSDSTKESIQDYANRNNVLHLASRHNHLGIIEALIKEKVDVNFLDKDRFSSLCFAIKHNNQEAISLLLQAGAEVNIGAGVYGTALHMAVFKGDLWLVKELMQKGAKVNLTDEQFSNTPLYNLFSCFDRSPLKSSTIAETLILANANPNAKNKEGWCPIHIASKKGQSKAIKWIIKNNSWIKDSINDKFDINSQGGNDKWTPLHLAGHSGHYKLVLSFIRAGADLFLRNSDNKTPRHVSKGNLAIYKTLRKAEIRIIRQKLGIEIEEELLDFQENSGDRTVKYSSTVFRASCIGNSFGFPIVNTLQKQISPQEIISSNEKEKNTNINLSIPPEPIIVERDIISNSLNYANRLSFNRTINIFYAKDRILNNKVPLSDRYKAINDLKHSPNKEKVRKAMNEIIRQLNTINNIGLRTDIINYIEGIQQIQVIQILEMHKQDYEKSYLGNEISSKLENIKLDMSLYKDDKTLINQIRPQLSISTKYQKVSLLGIHKSNTKNYNGNES